MGWSDAISIIDSADGVSQSTSGADYIVNISGAAAAVSTLGNLIITSPGTAIALNAEWAMVSAQKILTDLESGEDISLGDVLGVSICGCCCRFSIVTRRANCKLLEL